jgi:hypothetical protein
VGRRGQTLAACYSDVLAVDGHDPATKADGYAPAGCATGVFTGPPSGAERHNPRSRGSTTVYGVSRWGQVCLIDSGR